MFVLSKGRRAHAAEACRTGAWIGLVALSLALAFVALGCRPSGNSGPVLPTAIIVESEPTGDTVAPAVGPATPAPTLTTAVAATVTALVATPSPGPASCDYNYFFEPVPDACPAGPPRPSAAAEQPFEGGVMVWLEERASIIVFYPDGRWRQFADTWSEGEPESDPAIVPPDGRFQPIRGFGKLWRETPELRQELGWALGVELGFESMLQEQAPAQDQPALTYLLTYNGQVFALVQRELDQGDWVLAADNR